MVIGLIKDIRVRFLLHRMKKMEVDYGNYPEFKDCFVKVLKILNNDLPDFAYRAMIRVIQERNDLPDDMKADLIVTAREYMHRSPVYMVMKEFKELLDVEFK